MGFLTRRQLDRITLTFGISVFMPPLNYFLRTDLQYRNGFCFVIGWGPSGGCHSLKERILSAGLFIQPLILAGERSRQPIWLASDESES
jgi:hypothetical protein